MIYLNNPATRTTETLSLDTSFNNSALVQSFRFQLDSHHNSHPISHHDPHSISYQEQEAAQALLQLGNMHIDTHTFRRSSSCTTLDTAVMSCSSVMSHTSSNSNSSSSSSSFNSTTIKVNKTAPTTTETKKNKRRRHRRHQRQIEPYQQNLSIKSWQKKKPRWQDPERESLFKAVIEDKRLDDMATFRWDKIAKLVGRAGKACKDQWRREILPALKDSLKP